MQRTDLGLWEVIALDKVQKGKPITENEFKLLKAKRLVEGRRPNLFVSAEVAAATETKDEYIRKRAFDKQHYKKMVEDYLRQFHLATRADFDKLLIKKLSEALNSKQKRILLPTCSRRCAGKGLSGLLAVNEAKGPSGNCIKWTRKTWLRLCFTQFNNH